jgi:hypothetical protein
MGLKMEKCLNVVAHGVVLVVRRVDNYAHLHTLFMWLGAMSRVCAMNWLDLVNDVGCSRSRNLLGESMRRWVFALLHGGRLQVAGGYLCGSGLATVGC